MSAQLKRILKTWILPPGISQMLNRLRIAASFLRSPEDRKLLNRNLGLKNRHRGSRCFVLGAGSSIQQQDLQKLKGEFVISVSNTFVHSDFPVIKPHYHVTPHMIYGHSQFYSEERFVRWLREMETGTFNAEMFFHIGDRKMIEGNGLFRNRVIHWVDHVIWDGDPNRPIDLARIPHIWSVSELAITVAIYLGFDEIYLLGIDHDWFIGPQVYFYDQAKHHALQPHLINLDIDAEFQMRRHADIFKKYKYLYGLKNNIYNANANPSHYLDVFPKVDFDSLFKSGSE